MNKFSQSTFFGLFILIIAVVRAEYYHKIEPFSFDLKKFEYPLEWKKWGATVALKKSIKLMPKVENRFGGLWLSQVSIVYTNRYFHILFKMSNLHFKHSRSKLTCSKCSSK